MMYKITDGMLGKLITDLEFDDNASLNDTYDAFIELRAYRAAAPLEKVQELVKAEQEGRLVVLPCKLGTVVYVIEKNLHWDAHTEYWEKDSLLKTPEWIIQKAQFCYLDIFQIGKTVFLTHAEAQAALDAQKGANPHA